MTRPPIRRSMSARYRAHVERRSRDWRELIEGEQQIAHRRDTR